ncbi:TPA: hypothetical protein ACH3X1_002822 [Trebouxia sp. C0004]
MVHLKTIAEVAAGEAAEEQTEEELVSSLTAALARLSIEYWKMKSSHSQTGGLATSRNIYSTLDAAIWTGEYVTVQPEPGMPAFGQDEEAVSLDVDRDELYRRLSRN